VAHSVEVSDGLRCAPASDGVVRSWANRGECGGKVVEGLCERCTRVSDGDGDEYYPPPLLLDERNEGGVLFGFSTCFLSHRGLRRIQSL